MSIIRSGMFCSKIRVYRENRRPRGHMNQQELISITKTNEKL